MLNHYKLYFETDSHICFVLNYINKNCMQHLLIKLQIVIKNSINVAMYFGSNGLSPFFFVYGYELVTNFSFYATNRPAGYRIPFV